MLEEMFNSALELEITAISNKKIPFNRNPSDWKEADAKMVHIQSLVKGVIYELGDGETGRKNAVLMTSSGPVDVTIPFHTNCTCTTNAGQKGCRLYDGYDDCILNMDNEVLWSWELLDRWWSDTLFLTTTYHGWWRSYCELL